MTVTAVTERRELAHRSSDGIEVTLFWNASTNRVTLEVLDSRSEETLEFDVDVHVALDAFNHPFAYCGQAGAGGSTTPPCDGSTTAAARLPDCGG